MGGTIQLYGAKDYVEDEGGAFRENGEESRTRDVLWSI